MHGDALEQTPPPGDAATVPPPVTVTEIIRRKVVRPSASSVLFSVVVSAPSGSVAPPQAASAPSSAKAPIQPIFSCMLSSVSWLTGVARSGALVVGEPCTGGEAVPDGPGLADGCNAEGCVDRACYWPSITRTRVFDVAAPMLPRGGVTCHVALGEYLPAAFWNGLLQHQPLRYTRRDYCNSARCRHVVPASAQRTSTLIGADCEDSTLFTSTAETAK